MARISAMINGFLHADRSLFSVFVGFFKSNLRHEKCKSEMKLRKKNNISDGYIWMCSKIVNGEQCASILNNEGENAELIYYNRPDTDGPKLSSYRKQVFKDSEEAEGLKNVLASSLGILGVINKQRHLLMCGQTRIHVDHVKHLGHFMELEVMLNEEQTLEEGQLIANDLMEKLDVANDDLISGSYIDMLINKK